MLEQPNYFLSSKKIKQLAGKLLLYEELPLKSDEIDWLLQSKQLRKTPALSRQGNRSLCERCQNNDPTFFGTLPCARCKKSHLYCRKCLQMGRILACEYLYEWIGKAPVWKKHAKPCGWKGRLTREQSIAAERIVQAISHQERELLIWAVTGSGKTEILFPGITESLQYGLRICIAAPRVDVIRELSPRLRQAFPTISLEALYGESDDKLGSSQLILATTHQLLRYKQAFDVLIIDEIDAFPYHNERSLQLATLRAIKSSGTFVYLTATPRQHVKHRMIKGTLPYVFIPRRFHNRPLPVPQLRNSFFLAKQLAQNKLPKSFIHWFKNRQQNLKNRQLLMFFPTVAMVQNMFTQAKRFFSTFQKKVHYVHATDEDRALKIEQFRRQEIDVLMTTTILERGVTFPAIDVVVIDAGHQVFDEAALIQIAGRAGRHPKDPSGEVLFIHHGKTRDMVRAIRLIQRMNKKAGFK